MFTFKKIALLGAAGLAALSMSCSDDNGSDPGGSWTTDFGASFDNTTERVTLSGVVTATEGNTITSVLVEANGDTVKTIEPAITTGQNIVALEGTRLSGLCSLGDGYTGDTNFKIEITVSFVDGDNLTGTVSSVTVPCPAVATAKTLDTYTFTLGATSPLCSYVDLDAKVTKCQADARADRDVIDFAAYPGNSECADGTVCASWYITNWYNAEAGSSLIYAIPDNLQSAAATVLDNATAATLQEFFESGYISALPGYSTDWGDSNVSIADGIWFIVYTDKEAYFAVKIVSANTTSKEVNFRAITLK